MAQKRHCSGFVLDFPCESIIIRFRFALGGALEEREGKGENGHDQVKRVLRQGGREGGREG